jgi:DNA-directed RNA polymerase subunit RPC12/RpoP
MIETQDPKTMDKPTVRCAECDREVEHYNTFLSPSNEERVVCWECLGRDERGFNAKRDFHRDSRRGVIPR